MTNNNQAMGDNGEDLLPFQKLHRKCMKIDVEPLHNIDSIKDQMQIIFDILLLPANMKCHPLILATHEKYIVWGCKLVNRFIEANVNIDGVVQLLDSMKCLYDYLPISSELTGISLFTKSDLMVMFRKFRKHFDSDPENYIKIFTKIWTFCQAEINHEDVMETIFKTIIGKVLEPSNEAFLKNLFEYCGFIIRIYIQNHGEKISSSLTINQCIQLLSIVVQTKKHAVARLKFWWQFICSVKTETLLMMSNCIEPFLSNLFGKYVTHEQETLHEYGLSRFNCFNNKRELGPLCNFVMTQFLQTITRSISSGLPKCILQFDILDKDLFKENYQFEHYIEPLLMAFYYWCQFTAKIKINLPFFLFQIVFNGFANRFIASCDYKLSDVKLCKDPDDFNPILFRIVNKCIKLKNLLEKDLDPEDRAPNITFSDNLLLIRSIIESLNKLGHNFSFIPRGRDIIKCLLLDNLSLIKVFSVRNSDRGSYSEDSLMEKWLTNNTELLHMLMPDMCSIEQGFMLHELDEINNHWLCNQSDDDFVNIIGHYNIWSVHIKLWCYFSSKLCSEFNKSNFTLTYVRNCEELQPFFIHLLAPILFFQQECFDSLDKKDYTYIWRVHEELYRLFFSKASFITGVKANDIGQQLCMTLTNYLSKINLPSCKQHTVLNFITRFLCHVIYYYDSLVDIKVDNKIKDNSIWRFIDVLTETYKMLKLSNFRITLKLSSPRRRIFLNEISFYHHNSRSPFLRTFDGKDMEFTYGLILSTIERLILKMGNNSQLITSVLDELSSLIIGRIILFLSNKDKRGLKNNSYLNSRDILEIEQFIVSFLKSVEISCQNENIFSVLLPLFSILFSFKEGVLSRPSMEFVVDFWNNKILINAEKNGHLFSTFSIQRLMMTRCFHSNINMPSQWNESDTLNINTDDQSTSNRSDGGEDSFVGSSNKGKSDRPRARHRPPKRQSFLISNQLIDNNLHSKSLPISKPRRSSKSKSSDRNSFKKQTNLYNYDPDVFTAHSRSKDDWDMDSVYSSELTDIMTDNILPFVFVEDIRLKLNNAYREDLYPVDNPCADNTNAVPENLIAPVETISVMAVKSSLFNIQGQCSLTSGKNVLLPLGEKNICKRSMNNVHLQENNDEHAQSTLEGSFNADRLPPPGIMRATSSNYKKAARVSFSDSLIFDENAENAHKGSLCMLPAPLPAPQCDIDMEYLADTEVPATCVEPHISLGQPIDSNRFQDAWQTVISVLDCTPKDQKAKYMYRLISHLC